MAHRIEPFEVVVPGGTDVASFQQTPLVFSDGRVDRLEIRIPPGPSGLVGFRVAHSGQSVIPYTGDRWFITDNDKLDWDLDNYPTGGAWELWAYNLDVYDHAIYLWFHITETIAASPPVVTPVVIEPLATAEDFDPIPDMEP
jgi:hypothetical protein